MLRNHNLARSFEKTNDIVCKPMPVNRVPRVRVVVQIFARIEQGKVATLGAARETILRMGAAPYATPKRRVNL